MPIRFPALLGNDTVKQLLSHQLASSASSHAYLIEGPSGSGKTILARSVFAALLCQSTSPACMECTCCRKIMGGLTPDVITLSPLPDKKQITVEQIRQLRNEAYLSPTELSEKAFLIEPADAMNTAAQNALLKVLEEPPHGVRFFLITSASTSLLPTVRSRCQTIQTEPLPTSLMSEHLRSTLPEADRLARSDCNAFEELIRRADGRLGLAEQMLLSRKKAFDPDPVAKEYLSLLAHGTHAQLQQHAMSSCKDREQMSALIDRMQSALRDLIACKRFPSAPLFFYTDREEAASLSERFTFASLMALSELLIEYARLIRTNVNLSSAQLMLCEQARQILI